jgi:hypothetical protein
VRIRGALLQARTAESIRLATTDGAADEHVVKLRVHAFSTSVGRTVGFTLVLGLMPPPDPFQKISDANRLRLVHRHTKVLPYVGPNLRNTLVVAEVADR